MSYLHKLSIRTQFIYITSASIIVILFIMLFSYLQIKNMITNQNEEYVNDILHRNRQIEKTNIDLLNRLSSNLAYNGILQQYLVETDRLKKYELVQFLSPQMESAASTKDGILDVVIVANDESALSLHGGGSFAKQFILPQYSSVPYYSNVVFADYGGVRGECFVVSTPIYQLDPFSPNHIIGTLFLIVDVRAVTGEQNVSQNAGTKLYLVDRDQKIFVTDQNQLKHVDFSIDSNFLENTNRPFTTNIENQKVLIEVEDFPEIGGRIVSITPEAQLLSKLNLIQNRQLGVFTLAMLLLFIPFLIIMKNIVGPVKRLIIFIRKIKTGNIIDMEKRIHIHGFAEMAVLTNEFNSMLNEIGNLTHSLLDAKMRLYETKLAKNQSELAYLRSQINPHFLYNTLESIKGLAALKGVPEIREVSQALARIFRYSIKGDHLVLLHEEIKMVKAYVMIQEVRFSDRFKVTMDFPEEILDYKIPKMIMQPIVENAISHGLEPKLDKGHLHLMARLDDHNELTILVKDNGCGIDQNQLESIQTLLSENIGIDFILGDMKTGIGLLNVNYRIKSYYGEGYGVQIHSKLGEGTEVLIRIPREGEHHV